MSTHRCSLYFNQGFTDLTVLDISHMWVLIIKKEEKCGMSSVNKTHMINVSFK